MSKTRNALALLARELKCAPGDNFVRWDAQLAAAIDEARLTKNASFRLHVPEYAKAFVRMQLNDDCVITDLGYNENDRSCKWQVTIDGAPIAKCTSTVHKIA
jgi:hypothetical protein